MLCVNSYPRQLIADCRSRIEQQIAAYDQVVELTGGGGDAAAALARFDPLFFSNLLVAMDACFVHRSRTLEKKDGNPLNEVRMLASSIVADGGVMTADKSIKYDAAKSVSKIAVGDAITLDRAGFAKLAAAFFDDMEARFSAAKA